ncbi:YunG family protein [Nocardia terpenica]
MCRDNPSASLDSGHGLCTIDTLKVALQKSWSVETSNTSDWSENDPARGQCAVTACVVQDYLGGDIVNTVATTPDGATISHYLNVIDGRTIDLTHKQFPSGTSFSEYRPRTKGFRSTRDYCLSYDSTARRWVHKIVRIVPPCRLPTRSPVGGRTPRWWPWRSNDPAGSVPMGRY